MARTQIPLTSSGTNKVAEHNLYDFRPYFPGTGNIWFVNSGGTAGSGLSPRWVEFGHLRIGSVPVARSSASARVPADPDRDFGPSMTTWM